MLACFYFPFIKLMFFFNFIIQYFFNWRLGYVFFFFLLSIGFFTNLKIARVMSDLFVCYSLLNLSFLKGILAWDAHFMIYIFVFWVATLKIRATVFSVIVQPFIMALESPRWTFSVDGVVSLAEWQWVFNESFFLLIPKMILTVIFYS